MARKHYTVEQIMRKLREAEVEVGRGASVPDACRKIGVSGQTYYRWRKESGGLRLDQARRLNELERENAGLKKMVADQALAFLDVWCHHRGQISTRTARVAQPDDNDIVRVA
jgi:putative transposase